MVSQTKQAEYKEDEQVFIHVYTSPQYSFILLGNMSFSVLCYWKLMAGYILISKRKVTSCFVHYEQ